MCTQGVCAANIHNVHLRLSRIVPTQRMCLLQDPAGLELESRLCELKQALHGYQAELEIVFVSELDTYLHISHRL